MLLISSEYGVLDIDQENIVERNRLQSGEMIGLDLKYGKVLKDTDINDYLKSTNPYMKWLNENMIYLQEHVDEQYVKMCDYDREEMVTRQRFYNFTQEVIEKVIEPMMKDGKEAVGSMGDDTPMAAFSEKQRNFSDFFKQKFAQVTNPPIDPIREKVVMSLNTGCGEVHNILDEAPSHAHRLKAISPVITKEKLNVSLTFGAENTAHYQDCTINNKFTTAFKGDIKKAHERLVSEVSISVI